MEGEIVTLTRERARAILTEKSGVMASTRDSEQIRQEPTKTSKKSIRTRYLGHVTGYQSIRDKYFLKSTYRNLFMETMAELGRLRSLVLCVKGNLGIKDSVGIEITD
eukprot:sb/3477666/